MYKRVIGIMVIVLALAGCNAGDDEMNNDVNENVVENNGTNNELNQNNQGEADDIIAISNGLDIAKELTNINEFYKQTKYPSNFKKELYKEEFAIKQIDEEIVYIVKDQRYLLGEEDGISVHSITTDVSTHDTTGTRKINDNDEFLHFGNDIEEVKDGVFANRNEVRWIDAEDGYLYKFSFGQPDEMIYSYDEMIVQEHGFTALDNLIENMVIPKVSPEGYEAFFIEYKHTKELFSDPYRTHLEIIYRNADDKKIHFNVYGGFNDIGDAYYNGKTNKTYGDIDVLSTTSRLEFIHNDLYYDIDFRFADEEIIKNFTEDLLGKEV